LTDRLGDIPYTEELDPYVDGEGPLELETLLATLFASALVHRKRERQMFEVVRREEPDFLKHTGEGAGRESTAREAKNTDLVPEVI